MRPSVAKIMYHSVLSATCTIVLFDLCMQSYKEDFPQGVSAVRFPRSPNGTCNLSYLDTLVAEKEVYSPARTLAFPYFWKHTFLQLRVDLGKDAILNGDPAVLVVVNGQPAKKLKMSPSENSQSINHLYGLFEDFKKEWKSQKEDTEKRFQGLSEGQDRAYSLLEKLVQSSSSQTFVSNSYQSPGSNLTMDELDPQKKATRDSGND